MKQLIFVALMLMSITTFGQNDALQIISGRWLSTNSKSIFERETSVDVAKTIEDPEKNVFIDGDHYSVSENKKNILKNNIVFYEASAELSIDFVFDGQEGSIYFLEFSQLNVFYSKKIDLKTKIVTDVTSSMGRLAFGASGNKSSLVGDDELFLLTQDSVFKIEIPGLVSVLSIQNYKEDTFFVAVLGVWEMHKVYKIVGKNFEEILQYNGVILRRDLIVSNDGLYFNKNTVSKINNVNVPLSTCVKFDFQSKKISSIARAENNLLTSNEMLVYISYSVFKWFEEGLNTIDSVISEKVVKPIDSTTSGITKKIETEEIQISYQENLVKIVSKTPLMLFDTNGKKVKDNFYELEGEFSSEAQMYFVSDGTSTRKIFLKL